MFKRPMAWAVKHKKWVLVLLAGGQGRRGELKRCKGQSLDKRNLLRQSSIMENYIKWRDGKVDSLFFATGFMFRFILNNYYHLIPQ